MPVDLRSERVVLHVRKAEKCLLEAAASRAGQRASEWARSSLLRLAQLVEDEAARNGHGNGERVRQD